MTLDDWLRVGAVRARLDVYRSKKDVAIQCAARELRAHSAPYVALSGGKDSVVLAFLVADAARLAGTKNCRLWTHISDASFPGTLETCEEVAQRIGMPLDIYESPVSAFEAVKAKKKQAFGKSGTFFDSVRAYARDKDLAFTGVRAAESKRRDSAAQAHGMVFHSRDMGDVDVVNPLQWFSLADVFAATVEYGAPIHPIYSKFSVDVGKTSRGDPRFIRLGYVTAKDLMDRGTVLFIRANYPELYARLILAFPEAARYG